MRSNQQDSSPKSTAERKSELIKLELQKYRLLKAKTSALKGEPIPEIQTEHEQPKFNPPLNKNRISLAELLSPQTYQNLMMVKDDKFNKSIAESQAPAKKPQTENVESLEIENKNIAEALAHYETVNFSKGIKPMEIKSPDFRPSTSESFLSPTASIKKELEDKISTTSFDSRSNSKNEKRQNIATRGRSPSIQSQKTPIPKKNTPEKNVRKSITRQTPQKNQLLQSNSRFDFSTPASIMIDDGSIDGIDDRVKRSETRVSRGSPFIRTDDLLEDIKKQLSNQKKSPSAPGSPNRSCSTGARRLFNQNSVNKRSTPDLSKKAMNLSATRDSGSKFYPRKTLDPKTSSNANLSNSKKIDADLTEEVNKWKQFGKMMAESYEDLNKKFINYNKEREKDKKVIAALKEQVNTLKQLLKMSQDETLKTRDFFTTKADTNTKDSARTLYTDRDRDQYLREEIEFLRNENEALKKAASETEKYKEEAEYYRKLSEAKFKECSALAEEIICLRTELDRSHSNYLRIQREQLSQLSGSKPNSSQVLKPRQNQENTPERDIPSTKILRKSITDMSGYSNAEEVDDVPPSPIKMSIMPTKEERKGLR